MHGFPLFLALTLQTAASAATPEELLRGAAVDWTKIRTLSVRVSRLTTKDRATQREQWKFQFRQPEQFRIDYSFPQERLIVTDDQEMLEYLPALHRAARTRFMNPAKR